MFCSSLWFCIVIILIYYAEGNDLDNMVVVLGRQISMTCGKSANDSSVQWKVQTLGDSEERFIFNGRNIFQEFSEFLPVVDGRFRLSTVEAQVKHAGTYFCIRITGHRTKTYSAKLTILESEPICGTNASNADNNVVENDYLELWCKIRYIGGLIPRMEWHRSDGENLTANSTYDLQEMNSIITQQMKAEDNTVNYTVTTFFETTARAASYENVVAASNKPEFKWVFLVNVLCTSLDKFSKGLDTFVYVGVGAVVTGIIFTTLTAVMCRISKCRRKVSNPKIEDARSSSHVYEYVSAEDVHSLPTTLSQGVINRTTTSEDIIDEAITSDKEDIDSSTHSEQEYDTISGRPHIQPVQVYTALKAAYENLSYPEA